MMDKAVKKIDKIFLKKDIFIQRIINRGKIRDFVSNDCTIGIVSSNSEFNMLMDHKDIYEDDHIENTHFKTILENTNSIKTTIDIKKLKQMVDFYYSMGIKNINIRLMENESIIPYGIIEHITHKRPIILYANDIISLIAPTYEEE